MNERIYIICYMMHILRINMCESKLIAAHQYMIGQVYHVTRFLCAKDNFITSVSAVSLNNPTTSSVHCLVYLFAIT